MPTTPSALEDLILREVGAEVIARPTVAAGRRGLEATFAGWSRQGGPKFSIAPSGLNRHRVAVSFGTYARRCIEHIAERASAEEYALARSFVLNIAESHDVNIAPEASLGDWRVTSELEIEVIVRGIRDQHDLSVVERTAREVLIPMIAAMAELIGYTEDDLGGEHLGEIEGRLITTTQTRRERNPRNRLLCISVHGTACAVCGLDPATVYGEALGAIIEIHHIEPLAETGSPRIYDPRTELIPLCPNCHRAIHRTRPALTPDKLREIIGPR